MARQAVSMLLMCLMGSAFLDPVQCRDTGCKYDELRVAGRCREATKVSDVKPEVSYLMKTLVPSGSANNRDSRSITVQEVNGVTKKGLIDILAKLQEEIREEQKNAKAASEVGDAMIWVRELTPGGDAKLFSFSFVRHADTEETLSYRVLAVKANWDGSVSFMMTAYTQTVSKLTLEEFAKQFALTNAANALTAVAALLLTGGVGVPLGAFASSSGLQALLGTVGLPLAKVASGFVNDYAATGKIGQADRDLAEAIFFSEMLTRANTKCIHPGTEDEEEAESGFYIAWKPAKGRGDL